MPSSGVSEKSSSVLIYKMIKRTPEHIPGPQPIGDTQVALTRAPELLAFDLPDTLVGKAPGAGTAGPSCLDGVGT